MHKIAENAKFKHKKSEFYSITHVINKTEGVHYTQQTMLFMLVFSNPNTSVSRLSLIKTICMRVKLCNAREQNNQRQEFSPPWPYLDCNLSGCDATYCQEQVPTLTNNILPPPSQYRSSNREDGSIRVLQNVVIYLSSKTNS